MGGTKAHALSTGRQDLGGLARDVVLVELQDKGKNVATSSAEFERLAREKQRELRRMDTVTLDRVRREVDSQLSVQFSDFEHRTPKIK